MKYYAEQIGSVNNNESEVILKMKDFKSYRWGWIKKDGVREQTGVGTSVLPGDIIGVWGTIHRDGFDENFYHETFRVECNSKSEQPLTRLLDLNREQCMRFAYPENIPASNVVVHTAIEEAPKTQIFQTWKCKECEHTFYTTVGPKDTLRNIFCITKIKCEVCKNVSAVKTKKVTKEIV